MIKIRNAVKSDIPSIMTFIREHWNENHIFAHNEMFFRYAHGGKSEQEKINFIIAEDDEDKKIYGIEGYILMNDEEKPDIAGTMWKALPCDYFMLGMQMREYMIQSLNARLLCSPGINMKTNGVISQYLGYQTNKLKHYYRLNDLTSYSIAKVNHKEILEVNPSNYTLVKIETFDEVEKIVDDTVLKKKKPFKNLRYLKERYFMHPIYKYDAYAIYNAEGKSRALFILREVEYNGSKMAKIVDFLGEDKELAHISQPLDELIRNRQYEFIDFYCHGLEHEIMTQAGFSLRDEKDENIIPNYFEPFLQQNVEIYFLCDSDEEVYVYRGDGDQDRPSK